MRLQVEVGAEARLESRLAEHGEHAQVLGTERDADAIDAPGEKPTALGDRPLSGLRRAPPSARRPFTGSLLCAGESRSGRSRRSEGPRCLKWVAVGETPPPSPTTLLPALSPEEGPAACPLQRPQAGLCQSQELLLLVEHVLGAVIKRGSPGSGRRAVRSPSPGPSSSGKQVRAPGP